MSPALDHQTLRFWPLAPASSHRVDASHALALAFSAAFLGPWRRDAWRVTRRRIRLLGFERKNHGNSFVHGPMASFDVFWWAFLVTSLGTREPLKQYPKQVVIRKCRTSMAAPWWGLGLLENPMDFECTSAMLIQLIKKKAYGLYQNGSSMAYILNGFREHCHVDPFCWPILRRNYPPVDSYRYWTPLLQKSISLAHQMGVPYLCWILLVLPSLA